MTADLVITRTLHAPRAVVFQAFAEAEHLAAWWGPKGCRLEVRHLDFRPGGRFHYGMHMPGGLVMWGTFDYREINAPEKIVFVNAFADADGKVIRAPFSESWPLQMLNTLTLEEQDNQTILTLRVQALDASQQEQQTFAEGFESMRQGFGATFDQLTSHIASRPA